jgi:hypothetical protein
MQSDPHCPAPGREVMPSGGQGLSPPCPKEDLLKLDTSVALWLILFVFGGGLLALYYGGIGYFPEVSWQDALTYLALMTIIGGCLLVAYSFLLFAPGAIWSEFLVFDPQLYPALTMSSRQWEPCVVSITKRIVLPFTLFMAFCHFLLYVDGPSSFVALGAVASLTAVSGLLVKDLREGLEANPGQETGVVPDSGSLWMARAYIGASHAFLLGAFIAKAMDVPVQPDCLWVFALLPALAFCVLLVQNHVDRRRQRRGSKAKTLRWVPDEASLLCRSLLAFDSAALLSFSALWFFYRLYRGRAFGTFGQSAVPAMLLLLCTLIVIVTNLVVSALFHKSGRQALLASFLAALLLLGAGQLLPPPGETLPAMIMETFGFGGDSGTLVLTRKGGRILCQFAVPVEFEARLPAEGGATIAGEESSGGVSPGGAVGVKAREERLAWTANVRVLSRLGSEILLRVGTQKIALPKTEVVSWSPNPSWVRIQDGCKLYGDARP